MTLDHGVTGHPCILKLLILKSYILFFHFLSTPTIRFSNCNYISSTSELSCIYNFRIRCSIRLFQLISCSSHPLCPSKIGKTLASTCLTLFSIYSFFFLILVGEQCTLWALFCICWLCVEFGETFSEVCFQLAGEHDLWFLAGWSLYLLPFLGWCIFANQQDFKYSKIPHNHNNYSIIIFKVQLGSQHWQTGALIMSFPDFRELVM